MIILKLIPVVMFLAASVLSIIFLIDIFYNIRKKDTIKRLKRYRNYAIAMVLLCTFLVFFQLGMVHYTSAFTWVFALLIWLLNAILNNRGVVKMKNEETEIVKQPEIVDDEKCN